MNIDSKLELTAKKRALAIALVVILLIGGVIGYFLIPGVRSSDVESGAATDARQVLYYYDPMFPQQKFEKPGKSPFMDMQLIPKYADGDGGGAAGVSIDPSIAQNLGIRSAVARFGTLKSDLTITGTIEYNQRDIAIVQARAPGFVERTYSRAPGDVVARNAPFADILVTDWGGAQAEFIALRRTGNAEFAAAARARLRLLGMPEALIREVERTGRPNGVYTARTPVGGAIDSLSVRPGMTVSAGQSLAQVNGLGTVWLYGAVPETRAGDVRPGQIATAALTAFPGEQFLGRVISILPAAQAESRTLTALIELPNRAGRLRPGMFATVSLGQSRQDGLLVPSEAVIDTGERTLVMLATGRGRYRPAEVRIGRESGGQTEILAGLSEGEKVIVSGQFLVDSEASLSGIQVRPIAPAGTPMDKSKTGTGKSGPDNAGRAKTGGGSMGGMAMPQGDARAEPAR